MRKSSIPLGRGQARALAPPPSRLTTGSLRTLGRVRRRGRGGGRGGGGGGDACRAHGQSHRTSVCPDRRGESGRHLLLGSLRALPALGGCCGRGVLPAPSLGVPTRLQRCVFDRPSAKQLPQGRRAWGGLGGRDRSTGKGGAAPAASLASAVRAPSFPLLNAPDFPGSLHVVLCVPLSVGLREWRSGRIP